MVRLGLLKRKHPAQPPLPAGKRPPAARLKETGDSNIGDLSNDTASFFLIVYEKHIITTIQLVQFILALISDGLHVTRKTADSLVHRNSCVFQQDNTPR